MASENGPVTGSDVAACTAVACATYAGVHGCIFGMIVLIILAVLAAKG